MACLAGTVTTVPTPQHSASTDSGVEQHHSTGAQSDVEPSASVDESGGGLVCPTGCSLALSTTGEFTDNMSDHNPARSTDGSVGEDECSCRVCGKILSSASSLDRHVLVHTGERPFKCGLCGSGFTTNGNMHRHIRAAHGSSPSTSYTDSEASCDFDGPRRKRRRAEEFNNNNNVQKRKSPDFLDDEPLDDTCKRSRLMHNDTQEESKICLRDTQPTPHACPACGKANFPTSSLLEAHLEQNHSDYPAKCGTCNLNFKDHRVLSRHRTTEHHSERSINSPTRTLRNSVIGFDDLTYVDFSAAKFPAIARAACEKSRHRPAVGEVAVFECCKCHIAFPCRTALDSHESDCGNQSSQSTSVTDESASGRDDFFARLDLQNKAALTEAREGKDLADIQSIISVTSGPILQNFARPDAEMPKTVVKVGTSISSTNARGGTGSVENHDDEVQDAFATEFRRMKLRGEFPCRLCNAVFPNLRALKGHNRAHVGADSKMPYPCNMCPFVSTDKAALTRHLRSHNGDRPYECSLCNYAFTTKANCERHLRNRHAKITREEVKRSIIYHPNEDPLNDTTEILPKAGVRDDNRRNESGQNRSTASVANTKKEAKTNIEEPPRQPEPLPSEEIQVKTFEKPEVFHGPPLVKIPDIVPQLPVVVPPTDMGGSQNSMIEPSYSKRSDDHDNNSTNDSVSLVNETKQEIHQRQDVPMNLKTSPSPASFAEEAPLDLSMDALDLSKKSKPRDSLDSVNAQQDFHKSNKEFYDARNQLLLTQVLMKAGQHPQPTTLETLYNANLLYHNFGSFPTSIGAAGLISPYLFNPHLLGQEFSMPKELVRERQLHSGGVMVKPQAAAAAAAAAVATAFEASLSRTKEASYHSKTATNDYPPKRVSPKLTSNKITRDKDHMGSSNSVKMVIKNGVLMPKQKQRRYRTERPFACEHCSARFTLRSNMERHVKQQHPQFWCQRQRGGNSTRGRPPANPPPTLLPDFNPSIVPQPLAQNPANILPKLEQASTTDYVKTIIPDQVKYAILAHQLKGNKVEEAESETEELVIDEEPAEENAEASAQHRNEDEKPLSLLRDKLEDRTALSKEVIMKQHVNEFSKEYLVKLREQHLETLKRYESTKTFEARPEPQISANNIKKEVVDEDASGTTSAKGKGTRNEKEKNEDGGVDLASVSRLLDNASQQYQQFQPQYLSDDEEGLIASNSEGNNSGSDDKSDSGNSEIVPGKKKSAYSLAPNRVSCPYCHRKFPWTSSLRRHVLTHTGQKPYKCIYCPLLFTTKSNCDRHLLRKHASGATNTTNPAQSSAAAAQTSAETSNALLNSNAFAMRNVPERPYKCNQCPSSTFSTLGNLKKHLTSKHSSGGPNSRSDSPSSESQNSRPGSTKQNDHTGCISPSSSLEETTVRSSPGIEENHKNTSRTSPSVDATHSVKTSPECGSTVSSCSSELPFKCHLCDGSFAERQDCLEHIKVNHKAEYELLVTKGALDMAAETETHPEEQQQSSQQHGEDGDGQRGKFPDYANRKVVCAFCMRRFWSAEDLRRHMRTHTGERPFSCDICRRRFTLKHSMLRHRKKHGAISSAIYTGSGDEEQSSLMPAINSNLINGNSNASKGQNRSTGISSVAGVDATLLRFGAHEKLTSISGKPIATRHNSNAEGAEDNNDLITNLLGLNDKTIVDRVLQSPDDAAKLLGVQRSQD